MKTIYLPHQTLLQGLMFACPMGKSVQGCPFKMLRLINVERRLSIIEKLPLNELHRLVEYHKNCLCKQELASFKRSEKVQPEYIFA